MADLVECPMCTEKYRAFHGMQVKCACGYVFRVVRRLGAWTTRFIEYIQPKPDKRTWPVGRADEDE